MTYNALIHGQKQPVILIVCPPSHDQQGRKMAATMAALEGWDIQGLYMADTLDRHNGKSKQQAYDNGTAWLERHADLIKNIPVIRWEELKDVDFFMRYKEVINLYKHNDTAKKAVNDICRPHAELIATRIEEKGNTPDRVRIMRNSVNYMLEEIAGLSIIRSATDAPEVYPGAYFEDNHIFARLSPLPLTLPSVLPVTFEKMRIAA